MTFSPTKPIRETTADGKPDCKRNVCAIRHDTPSGEYIYWQCNAEHGAGWTDRIRQAWTLREARLEVQKILKFGYASKEQLEIVELISDEVVSMTEKSTPAPVDWEKAIQFDRAPHGDLEHIGVNREGKHFIYDHTTESAIVCDASGDYGGHGRIINVPPEPPKPRTVEVQVAGAKLLNGSDGIAIIDDQTVHFIDLTGAPPRPVACHIELESIGWRGFKISDSRKTVTLEPPE